MKALITGASSGIGWEMAKYLGNTLGYDLILVARREKRLVELQKEIKTEVKVLAYDLSDIASLDALIEDVENEEIDFLINNAGFGLFGEFFETDVDTEMKMIDVNIRAVHYLTKKFLIDFIKQDKGMILNVASSAGFMAGPKLSTYYATKNYCLRLTEAIYQELKMRGSHVSISVLCPGPVDTEFNKVAHGTFHTSSASAPFVAKYAIDKALKGKLIIIPTLKMKCVIFFSRFLPTKFLLRITYRIQDRKTKR